LGITPELRVRFGYNTSFALELRSFEAADEGNSVVA